MKYLPQVERPGSSSAESGDQVEGLDGLEVLELAGAGAEHGPARSARWLGLLIGVGVAVIGFGFVGHQVGPATDRPDRSTSDAPASERPSDPATSLDPGSDPPSLGSAPLVVMEPAAGATVTSGIQVTGGVVIVKATADQALGDLGCTVSIGGTVLGGQDVRVGSAGPFTVRIPVFPPAFDAPVRLRLVASPSTGHPGFVFERDVSLDIPSLVGFWDASPTGSADASGGVDIAISGYAPISARTVDLAISDPHGVVGSLDGVPVAYDADRPGAVGGRAFGLGSFVARVSLPAGTAGLLGLRATWRDAVSGSELHVDTSLPPLPGRTQTGR